MLVFEAHRHSKPLDADCWDKTTDFSGWEAAIFSAARAVVLGKVGVTILPRTAGLRQRPTAFRHKVLQGRKHPDHPPHSRATRDARTPMSVCSSPGDAARARRAPRGRRAPRAHRHFAAPSRMGTARGV